MHQHQWRFRSAGGSKFERGVARLKHFSDLFRIYFKEVGPIPAKPGTNEKGEKGSVKGRESALIDIRRRDKQCDP